MFSEKTDPYIFSFSVIPKVLWYNPHPPQKREPAFTWKTVSSALVMVSKLEVGLPSGKLNEPPKTCIPSSAKMKMKRKRRKSSDMMDEIAFISAITKFLSDDQYLEETGDINYPG